MTIHIISTEIDGDDAAILTVIRNRDRSSERLYAVHVRVIDVTVDGEAVIETEVERIEAITQDDLDAIQSRCACPRIDAVDCQWCRSGMPIDDIDGHGDPDECGCGCHVEIAELVRDEEEMEAGTGPVKKGSGT
jgi:hypothetical protein